MFIIIIHLCSSENADLLLILLDESYSDFIKEHSELLNSKKHIFIHSMSDLPRKGITLSGAPVLQVSSVTGQGIPELVSAIDKALLSL